MQLKTILILILCIFTLYPASKLRKALESELSKKYKVTEFRYLLPDDIIKLFAFGYDNAIGDLFWLKSLQNMDIRNQHIRRYSYLYHILNTASTLQPTYKPIYVGGGGFLTIIFWDYKGGEAIFLKGIKQFPDSIQLHTYLSMLYLTDLQDFDKAAYHMNKAANIKGAPDWYKKLAARLYVEAERPEVSYKIIKALYLKERNEKTKKELAKKLKLIIIDLHVVALNKLIKKYEKKYGKIKNLEQLISANIIRKLPLEPFGGYYYLDKKSKIQSSTTTERYRPFLQERYRRKNTKGRKHDKSN